MGLSAILLNLKSVSIFFTLIIFFVFTAPELVKQKHQSDEKISELTAVYNLTKMINSTLDIGKIITYIMNFIVESFRVKNCSVIIFDADYIKNRFYHQKDEKRSCEAKDPQI